MSNIVSAANTTAMTLGYIVLGLLLVGVIWIATFWIENWRYKRRRKRRHDIEWDNVRSKWLLEMNVDRVAAVEQHYPISDRVDTDVLNFTVDQIYDYQEEHRNDFA